MKERVAAEAPVIPPLTGASTNAGDPLLQPGYGWALGCSLASETVAASSLDVFGLMVEQSISSEALVPPAPHNGTFSPSVMTVPIMVL